MNPESINISQIINEITSKPKGDFFAVCWIKDEVDGIEIDRVQYQNVSNYIFFLDPNFQWKIFKKKGLPQQLTFYIWQMRF